MLFAPRSRTIDVYSSPTTHFVVGAVGSGLFRVLFFERSTTASKLSDILFADPKLYDRRRLAKLLRSTVSRTTSERRRAKADELDAENEDATEANRRQVPVHQFRAEALLGAFRFLKGYYLLFVTERKREGYINGHVVYSIESIKLFPITAASHFAPSAVASTASIGGGAGGSSSTEDNASSTSTGRSRAWSWLSSSRDPVDELEARYMSLFQLIDLTKGDFFFSYTLDLTNMLQSTFAREPVDDTFAWNEYLTSELRETIIFDEEQRLGRNKSLNIHPEMAKRLLWTTDSWLVPLIHGSFQQQRFSLLGKPILVTLLGRRSRYNAGTRYLKRGVNEQGQVANHVEVEQIVEVEGVSISSFAQVRGSIPTYWTQDTSAVTPKPPIKRFRSDPTFLATRIHFAELMMRYGEPIIVLNLVRRAEYEKSQRESKLGEEFADAVEFLNCSLSPEEQIVYDAIDFKRLSKVGSISAVLDDLARKDLDRVGVFATDPMGRNTNWSFQNGTIRTNCIDCLDRTNVGQFCMGLCALGIQLDKLQVTLPRSKTGGLIGPLLDEFVQMFESLGDRIAQQYGGSQAHKKGGVAPTSELLTSIRRYYNNSFNDRPKQDAMNLFLGCFIPCKVHHLVGGKLVTDPLEAELGTGPKALWDLDNDFYLHNFRVTDRSTFSLEVDPGTERWWTKRSRSVRRQSNQSMSSHHGGEGHSPSLALVPVSRTSSSTTELPKRIPSTSSFLALMALSRSPSPPVASSTSLWVIRPPLTDEEDSGVYVKFDKVLGDPFFRPIAVGAGNDEKLTSAPLRQSLKDRLFSDGAKLLNDSGISSTMTLAHSGHPHSSNQINNASDDEDESNATFSTNAIQRTGRLGSVQDPLHQFVLTTPNLGGLPFPPLPPTLPSQPNSMLMLANSAASVSGMGTRESSFDHEDNDEEHDATISTSSDEDMTSSLLNVSKAKAEMTEPFDFLGSVFNRVKAGDTHYHPDLMLFQQQAHVAQDTSDAFEERPVDPAIQDYMKDYIVGDEEVENIRRVMIDSNAVSREIPNGQFSGFKRSQRVSDLYSTTPGAPSVFAFECNMDDVEKQERSERILLEAYLKHAPL